MLLFRISSKNIKKRKRKPKKGPILVLSYQNRTKIDWPFLEISLSRLSLSRLSLSRLVCDVWQTQNSGAMNNEENMAMCNCNDYLKLDNKYLTWILGEHIRGRHHTPATRCRTRPRFTCILLLLWQPQHRHAPFLVEWRRDVPFLRYIYIYSLV